MTTLGDTLAETRRRFFTTWRPQINILTSSINSSETQITFDDPPQSAQAGANITIDLEIMRIRNMTGQVATVVRGFDGSTGAAHTSGAVITINPQITDFDIYREICYDLADLSSPDNGLFKPLAYEFNYSPVVQGYEITTADVIGVADVRYREPGPWRSWPSITKWRFDQTVATSDFASGNSLTLYESGYPGQKVHVVLMVPFTIPTALTDDMQDDVGLPRTANDLPSLGAAIRLGAGREVQRNFNETQGQPRRAEEVPAGANLGSFRSLTALRNQRVITEANRLKMTYPTYRR